VLVDGEGRIAEVGPADDVTPPAGAEQIDLGGSALLPGLVNAHAHPDLALFRGALEDLAFPDWIAGLMRGYRRLSAPDDFGVAARWSVVEALRAGITTLGATEASGASLEALRDLGLRGVVFHEVFGPDPKHAAAALAALRERVERARGVAGDRVRVGISPHAPYTVSDALYRGVAEYAGAERLPVAVHIAESAAERRLVAAGEGVFADRLRARGISVDARAPSPIALLDRLGLLGLGPLLIHCVDVGEEDVRRIADCQCTVAHCPVANARLGHGIAPLDLFREAGVRVGLGTDSAGSNNRMDMLEEARIASILQRPRLRVPDALPPAEVLRMCTLDAAACLGMEDEVGSIESGKAADLCAVSLDAPHVRPVHDPLAAVVHAARGSDVRLTMVAGRILYRDGRLPGVDVEELQGKMERAADRLREREAAG